MVSEVIFGFFRQRNLFFILAKESWKKKEQPQLLDEELQVTDCTPPTPQQGDQLLIKGSAVWKTFRDYLFYLKEKLRPEKVKQYHKIRKAKIRTKSEK